MKKASKTLLNAEPESPAPNKPMTAAKHPVQLNKPYGRWRSVNQSTLPTLKSACVFERRSLWGFPQWSSGTRGFVSLRGRLTPIHPPQKPANYDDDISGAEHLIGFGRCGVSVSVRPSQPTNFGCFEGMPIMSWWIIGRSNSTALVNHHKSHHIGG
jgi:hypothetical protein